MSPSRTRPLVTVLVAVLLTTASATTLAVPKTKPGQYTYSVAIKMMGMSMPPVSFSHCVTQKDIDDGLAYVNTNKQTDCSNTEVDWSGNDFTVDAVCKNPDRTMTCKGHATDTGMTMTMDVVMGSSMPMTQQQTITAQRVGDCSN